MPSYSRQIAEFCTDFKLSDVPEEVLERAKSVVLDGLGCGLFATQLPWTKLLSTVISKQEPQGGTASIWGTGQTASPANAALINGTMIQGYELDDANPASIHSCAAILPAVMAMVEQIGAENVSGAQLLRAIIAGFEIGPRVGHCLNGNRMLGRGWHTPGLFGTFPACVSAGIILGLSAEQHYQALGIVGPFSGGLMATQFGSMVKRMLSARAAQSGVYAACLAAEGFTGVEDIFEAGYGGYCTTFTNSKGDFDLTALTDGLGSRWETMRISIKRHACVGTNLSALDAIGLLMDEGLRAEDVESIVVWMTEDAVRHSFWTPYTPTGLTAAQMHLGYCIGMKLLEGEVFVDQMIEENIARPDVLALCEKVDVRRDEAREALGRPFARGARVSVTRTDGTTVEKTIDNFIGSYQNPMSDEQMMQKYRRLARKTLSDEHVSALEAYVRTMETAPDAVPMVALLKSHRH